MSSLETYDSPDARPADAGIEASEYDEDGLDAADCISGGYDGVLAEDCEEDIDDDQAGGVVLAPSRYSSEELADDFGARARADGVEIPPDMLRRAGEILSRERVVDPRAASGLVVSHGGLQNLVRMAMSEAPDETDVDVDHAADTPGPTQPTEALKPDGAPDTVGEELSSRWSASGVPLPELADRIGRPLSEVVELFSGSTNPDIAKVVIPVMRELGVAPSDGLALIDRYRKAQGYPVPDL